MGEQQYDFFKKHVHVGDFVGVTGQIFITHTGEVTINTEAVTLLSKAIRPMDYAFSPDFGFLAANPLNAGTGLEMSCLLHLPAVDMAQKLPQTLGSLSYWKLGWKPAFGETLETSGGLCLVYTTQKFGLTQEETCAGLKSGAAMAAPRAGSSLASLRAAVNKS